jgi:hypothetical protein
VNRPLHALAPLALAATAALAACRFERAPSGRPEGGYAPEPDSLASVEVYNALRGYYAALTSRDWRLLGTHFWPRATITTIRVPPGDTAERVHTLSIEEFVAGAGSVRAAVFSTEPVRASIVTYGDLADAWVTYRARVGAAPGAVAAHHGIDAFHLMRREGRWRIAGLAFQNEVPGRPIAPELPVRR